MCYNLREIDFYESEDKQMAENKRPESMQRITTPELAQAFIDEQLAALREQIGDKKVLLALSGGVDSSVVAASKRSASS